MLVFRCLRKGIIFIEFVNCIFCYWFVFVIYMMVIKERNVIFRYFFYFLYFWYMCLYKSENEDKERERERNESM